MKLKRPKQYDVERLKDFISIQKISQVLKIVKCLGYCNREFKGSTYNRICRSCKNRQSGKEHNLYNASIEHGY